MKTLKKASVRIREISLQNNSEMNRKRFNNTSRNRSPGASIGRMWRRLKNGTSRIEFIKNQILSWFKKSFESFTNI